MASQKIDYAFLARRAQRDLPELYNRLHNELMQLEKQTVNDIDTLPGSFDLFRTLVNEVPNKLQGKRCSQKESAFRRLFIAVAYQLYDPVYFNNFTLRARDKMRALMAESLCCCKEWISAVIESIRFEYKEIDEFRMQVDLLVYCIRMQGKHLA